MFTGKGRDNNKIVKLSVDQIIKILKKEKASDLKLSIKILKEASNLSAEEILNFVLDEQKEIQIPISIFQNRELGSLQILVKYLKENLNLNYSSIAKIINRDQRTIWTTYNVAVKKFKDKIEVSNLEFKIPITEFSNRNFSTLEVLVNFLNSNFDLKNSEISKLLNRDQRTIWTILKRIKGKKFEKSF